MDAIIRDPGYEDIMQKGAETGNLHRNWLSIDRGNHPTKHTIFDDRYPIRKKCGDDICLIKMDRVSR